MKTVDIMKNKRATAKSTWLVYMLCTIMMVLMVRFNKWDTWISVMLGLHTILITIMTFHKKISVEFQSVFLMIFSYWNVFVCGLMEHDIYPSIAVLIGVSILISVYRNEKLMVGYIALIITGLLFHIFVLEDIPLETSLHIIELVARSTVLFASQVFLIIFIRNMNKNEEEMLESIENAKRAEHYKSDFLANMSHEIRTPMNAIVGMCELILRENNLSECVRENCFNIQTSGRSLLAIINDILDFSKIDSGKMEINEDEFNIASTINDVINMSEARRGNKNIEIFVKADPDIPRGLIGDELRIRQVIINLMTNAIKFTEKGSVTLTVSHTKQEYGVNIFVSVKDTGIGITEENIERLFTSFRQVDTKKNRSVEGTGLGLAISKRLIQKMGGFISVSSEYGAGSEFKFTVPLKVKDEKPFVTISEPDKIHAVGCFAEDEYRRMFDETAEQLRIDGLSVLSRSELSDIVIRSVTHYFVSKEEYMQNEEFYLSVLDKSRVFVVQDRVDAINLPDKVKCVYKPFYTISVASAINGESIVLNLNERRGADIRFTAPKARILIVDDNAINLKVAAGLMRPYNMQILTAESGPAAIKMLRSKDVDLVFMDHMMPVMDGVEATGIIRATEGEYYKNLPIIALTANAVNGAREMFMQSGFNDFLAKPIELSALDRILRNYLPKEYMQMPTNKEYGGPERRKQEKPAQSLAIFDVDKGLSYTGGDMDVYREILDLYVKKGAEKKEHIAELFEQKDWKNYVIEVHALKSTSMSIGAVKLSELAKELELAGKAGTYAKIEKNNDSLLKLYDDTMATAREYLGDFGKKNEEPVDENTELVEITAEKLKELTEKAKSACESFDGDAVAEIAKEAYGYSYNGNPLREHFAKAADFAEDFEYESALAEISAAESLI